MSQLDLRKTSRSFFRKGSDTGNDDDKGPVGLTTVFEPSSPVTKVIADLVFVHGLGGGSHKTWTKDEDPSLFWPQEWLSKDDGFRDVRIHMFGYNSNWDKESVLNIHDFAKSLLEWVKDCPTIPRDAQVSSLPSVKNQPTTSVSVQDSPELGRDETAPSLLHSCLFPPGTKEWLLIRSAGSDCTDLS